MLISSWGRGLQAHIESPLPTTLWATLKVHTIKGWHYSSPHVSDDEDMFTVAVVRVHIRVAQSEFELVEGCISHRHRAEVVQQWWLGHPFTLLSPRPYCPTQFSSIEKELDNDELMYFNNDLISKRTFCCPDPLDLLFALQEQAPCTNVKFLAIEIWHGTKTCPHPPKEMSPCYWVLNNGRYEVDMFRYRRCQVVWKQIYTCSGNSREVVDLYGGVCGSLLCQRTLNLNSFCQELVYFQLDEQSPTGNIPACVLSFAMPHVIVECVVDKNECWFGGVGGTRVSGLPLEVRAWGVIALFLEAEVVVITHNLVPKFSQFLTGQHQNTMISELL